MNLPSRGLLESATTMRYMGAFLRPTRRRRILTAILSSPEVCAAVLLRAHRVPGVSRPHPVVLQGSLAHPAEHARRHSHLSARAGPSGRFLHHLLHLAELL